tara:strand:- start:905 stop:1600 length:696 start_codon:yes stop_codon:yes gene_type:complete
MKKILVVTPTLNEIKNISTHIDNVISENFDLLIVDDNSEDGTYEVVQNNQYFQKNVFLIIRKNKKGLGTAYIEGFNWALKRDYEFIVEMDCDHSHQIDDLILMMKIARNYDVIIGSRYVKNGKTVGWSRRRKLLSSISNTLSKTVTKSFINDMTSGFRIYKSEKLSETKYYESSCNGYSFQIDMTFRAEKEGLKIKEHPITFVERSGGTSKMNWSIIIEAIVYLIMKVFKK